MIQRDSTRHGAARIRTAGRRVAWQVLGGALLLVCHGVLAPDATAQAPLLERAHAHNDYLHERPLLDALEHGFNSVEVDIHLVGDELLVAHGLDEVVAGQTLERVYLAPLRERVRQNEWSIHSEGAPLLLLIDIKSDAEATYARLHPLLRQYADILTINVGDQVVEGPVIAVLSGNRPRSALLAAPVRFAAFDGRIEDLENSPGLSASFMPLVSESWSRVSDWSGEGSPPATLVADVGRLVTLAHGQGRRLRFWGTPDRIEMWEFLRDAGVDLINTDDLAGLQAFLSDEAN